MADLVTIATFVDRSELLIARSLLESEGLKVLAPDEHVLATLPHIVHAQPGYRLMVRVEDSRRAQQILQEARVDAAGDGADA